QFNSGNFFWQWELSSSSGNFFWQWELSSSSGNFFWQWELSSSSGNFFWQWEHITGSVKTALEVGMDRTFNSQHALTSVTMFLEYLTFDLLSMIDKHSRGILSKKFPPAAESSAS
nr:hypothetical protein [Tanacetum cinerariifolium]